MKTKNIPIAIIITIAISLFSCTKPVNHNSGTLKTYDSTNATNDLFDNTVMNSLELNELFVGGEVADSGIVDFSKLTTYTKLAKETILTDSGASFIGAYKYEGYSLHDILSPFLLKKKNAGEFKPIVDAYIEIENAGGEKVFFSWGEIFYPNKRHNIIIAKSVMRIIPVKSKDMWVLPTASKVVVLDDLYTERNISNPVKITVKSYTKTLKTVKGLKPLYSPTFKVFDENKLVDEIKELPKDIQIESLHTIFYGRGRGIHSTEAHSGIYLKEYLKKYYPITKKSIQKGLFVVSAKDGYRATFTYSEIMNRSDQSEVLLLCFPNAKDNGIFRILPTCDFFSDRAVKGITEIWYSESEQ